MAAATGPNAGRFLEPGCELFADELELPAIRREEFDLLEDGGGQPAGLPTNESHWIIPTTNAPSSNGSELTIGQGTASVDAQIAAAHQGDEGVAVGGALVINEVSSRQKNPQGSPFPAMTWASQAVVLPTDDRAGRPLGVNRVGLSSMSMCSFGGRAHLGDLDAF
jgi:hypothetical protein